MMGPQLRVGGGDRVLDADRAPGGDRSGRQERRYVGGARGGAGGRHGTGRRPGRDGGPGGRGRGDGAPGGGGRGAGDRGGAGGAGDGGGPGGGAGDGGTTGGGGARRTRGGCGGSRSGARAGAGGSTSPAADSAQPDQLGGDRERSQSRNQQAQVAAHPLDLGAEAPAVGAVTHVTTSATAGPNAAVMGDDEVFADRRTRGVTRLVGLRQTDSSAYEQRLHRRDRDAQGAGEVGVGHAAELPHQQRRSLLLGEVLDVDDQTSQRLSLLDSCVGIGPGRLPEVLDGLDGERTRPALLVHAAVMRDPVQPGAECEVASIRAQPPVGANEDLLDGVLGVGRAGGEHLPRIGEHARAVAVVDDAERVLVTGPEQGHELLVGAQPQQRCAEPEPGTLQSGGCWEGRGFHKGPGRHSNERAGRTAGSDAWPTLAAVACRGVMSAASGIGFPVAFIAGLVSFLSPCVLPLVPGYLSAVAGGRPDEIRTRQVIGPSLLFIGSFSCIFMVLGLLGQRALHAALAGPAALKISGAVIIVFGLLFVAAPFIPALSREWHFDGLMKRAGRGGPILIGAAFALAWTPCNGPTLGAIITATGTSNSASRGVILLAVYCAGLGVPFLITGLAFGTATSAFAVVRRHYPIVIGLGGAVLVTMGVLVFTGEFQNLNVTVSNWIQSIGLPNLTNLT
jgi:cytochrome c-type biogenesis protein